MNRIYIIILSVMSCLAVNAQQAYFVDGYHGGIYGHYPVEWKTQFIVDQLAANPNWKICFEIEPETWDTVAVRTPEAYRLFKAKTASRQVEFTNPAYAQPYCYNISGESIIRQFQYGIAKVNKHFPDVRFTTYSVEEPCFTSCLPQLLKLFGFKYAVLKCPNTCWGGYTGAYGGELVNWVGSDGTSILTVPRYACERLEDNSTWQTTAWNNSDAYLSDCFDAGIKHPVGMCFQDAGWKNGPWIGRGTNVKNNSEYVTWKEYIEHISVGKTNDNWAFSQEDMHVNLMWGSQVLQRIAQEVRTSENRIVMAEKLSVLAHLSNGYRCNQADVDEAWRTLMLSQHHDSWIVPYNGLNAQGTWADQIKRWTDNTNRLADGIIHSSLESFDQTILGDSDRETYLRVFNTLGVQRKELMNVAIPPAFQGEDIIVYDWKGKKVESAIENDGITRKLFFRADIPPFGFSTYRLKGTTSGKKINSEKGKENGKEFQVENDLYRIVFDLSKGGTIKSLIAKKEGGKDFVNQTGEYAFGELRGYFYEEQKFHSSTESSARITLLNNNKHEIKLRIEGEIATHPFVQTVTLTNGEKRIDFDLTIHWRKNVGIGEYKENSWRDNRRAYCDDRYKLSVLFPADLDSPQLYKDAPFDVCESRLDDTFFNRWDNIKHNIILNWVDIAERRKYGHALALLSDHTTSYSYGKNYPLGLTLQYSGNGLWGPDYKITGPSTVKYSLIPHQGRWDEAGISTQNDCRNEPLQYAFYAFVPQESESFIDLRHTGYRLSASKQQDGKILIRLFNAEGNDKLQRITFNMPLSGIDEIDLNNKVLKRIKMIKRAGQSDIEIAMPRFGIKTFLLDTI